MSFPLRFGVAGPQAAWPAMVERWQQAEALGFDSAWVIDHIVPRYDPSGACWEGWTALAGLAAHTTRLRVGVLTTNVLFRNPVLLAKQAVTVDHISRGRLEIALGSGNAAPSYGMAGIDPGTVDERIERLQEVVQIIDGLLRGEVVSFTGRFYRTDAAEMRPRSVQQPRPPLTIGAHRRAALRVVARYADKWSTFGGIGLKSQDALRLTRERSERLDEYCAESGRAPETLVRSFLVGFTHDTPFASLDAFQDFIGRYRASGISEFIFRWPQDAQLAMFERVASQALPSLREEVTSQGTSGELYGQRA